MSLAREHLRLALMRDEGTGPMKLGRLYPYTDTVGKITIGYGRNLTDRGISIGEAHTLLDHDIDDAIRDLIARYPWVETLDEARIAVLVNMSFNLGISRLAGFKQTLGCIRRGEYDSAAVGMLASKWAEQVGGRALRLAEQMRRGVAV